MREWGLERDLLRRTFDLLFGHVCQDIIFNRKAMIHFPYEMSTMSLAEQYSAGT